MVKQKIEDYIKSLGLDTFGMIPLRRLEESKAFFEARKEKQLQNEFEEDDVEKRIDPSYYLPGGKTIISIAFPYLHENMKENGFSVYTKRMDYHKAVRSYLERICGYIRDLGGQAECFVDSNVLPERYLAYLAGVGFVGRNNMIITKKYGSYVFLGEIITDLELPCEEVRSYEEMKEYKECGYCRQCYEECPTKSINAVKVNSNICLSYLTQKKDLTDQQIGLLKNNIFGCDFCQLKCPYNLGAAINVLPEFETMDCMNEDVKVYADMDNKYFKANVSQTSCGWRGKNVLRRNAMIQLAKQGEDLDQYRGDSPYINEYVERLKKLMKH